MQTQTYRVIGVMSGTSLDGIDLCEVEFKCGSSQWVFDILRATTIPYTNKWVNKLQNAHNLSKAELLQFDQNYTDILADVISNFMVNPENIDLVCSHGHTVFHQPDKGITYQIGNLPELAKLINKTLVCDFRTADVALGGQGAPLVPIGDRLLFAEYDYCINIGGFVNISFEKSDKRLAFDICPANKVLNYYAERLGKVYDDKGNIARQGKCNETLLKDLNAIEFYNQNPPKSLGIEWVEREMLPVLEQYDIPDADILHTLCEHIAFQISEAIEYKSSKVLITGGGAYHDFLISCIQQRLKSSSVIIPNPDLIEYKEALIFALLGILKFRVEVNVLKSVTGAAKNHSSGKVFEV